MKARLQQAWWCAAASSLALACAPMTPGNAGSTVSGSVDATSGLALMVSLQDSSPQAAILQTTPDDKGNYSFDVTGLRPPYVLTAEVMTESSTIQMYSVAEEAGTTDVTPETTTEYEHSHAGTGKGGGGQGGGVQSQQALFTQLSTVLAPLFTEFNVTFPLSSAEAPALKALMQAVQFSVRKGTVTVTNRQTGGTIFTGSLSDLSAGTFYPENLPPPPGATACTYTYSAWGACQPDGTQSRTVISAMPAGCTGTPVLSQACTTTPVACTYTYSAWGACQPDGTQSRTVISAAPTGCTGTPVLSQACTPAPVACTYTYSAWGACQPDGTQSRTVISAMPAGCAGTPVLSQACTFTAPNPVTFSGVVASCTSCHGLTSNTTVFKAGGYTVTGRSASNWLTTVNNMVALGSTLPKGATAQNLADYLATVP